MATLIPPPLVEVPPREEHPHVAQPRCAETTVPLCKTESTFDAEHLRELLILCEIHVAIIERDPLGCGFAIAEILVLSADHAKAAAILEDRQSADANTEWGCFNCGETVPGNFDVCWNCCETKIEAARQQEHKR